MLGCIFKFANWTPAPPAAPTPAPAMPPPGAHHAGAVRPTAVELLARAKDASNALSHPFPTGAKVVRKRWRVTGHGTPRYALLARVGSAPAVAAEPVAV